MQTRLKDMYKVLLLLYYSNSRMNGEKKKYFIQYFLTLSAFKKKNAYR